MNKMTLVRTIEKENFKNKIYSNGVYVLSVRSKDGYDSYAIRLDENCKEEYMPNLYVKTNIDNFDILDVEISTVSYGFKPSNDIKLIIKAYELALESVAQIKEIIGLI